MNCEIQIFDFLWDIFSNSSGSPGQFDWECDAKENVDQHHN